MPIITRSTTGPVRNMLPIKKTYDEMTSDEDSDSEYYPEEIRESMIDEIQELKEKLEISKNTESGLIDALVEEREKTRELQLEISEWIDRYAEMKSFYDNSQKTSYYTYLIILIVFIAGISTGDYICY